MDTKIHINTPAARIGNLVTDGNEFILLTRTRQSEGFNVYSSVDREATTKLFQQAAKQVDELQPA